MIGYMVIIKLRPVLRFKTSKFCSGPANFYTFCYKSMFNCFKFWSGPVMFMIYMNWWCIHVYIVIKYVYVLLSNMYVWNSALFLPSSLVLSFFPSHSLDCFYMNVSWMLSWLNKGCKDHFVYASSQWKHWLGSFMKWSLGRITFFLCRPAAPLHHFHFPHDDDGDDDNDDANDDDYHHNNHDHHHYHEDHDDASDDDDDDHHHHHHG